MKQDKMEEFFDLVDSSKILILKGPSGCGKNSLLRAFGIDKKRVVKY
jgi:hypothetical protein